MNTVSFGTQDRVLRLGDLLITNWSTYVVVDHRSRDTLTVLACGYTIDADAGARWTGVWTDANVGDGEELVR